jgi:hypothetical protein
VTDSVADVNNWQAVPASDSGETTPANFLELSMSRTLRCLPFLAALGLIGMGLMSAEAADLNVFPENQRSSRTYPFEQRGKLPRRVVSRRNYLVVRKLVGMPCLLSPDIIVRRGWTGPQCRYVDNM